VVNVANWQEGPTKLIAMPEYYLDSWPKII
jgi:hypothetical protein